MSGNKALIRPILFFLFMVAIVALEIVRGAQFGVIFPSFVAGLWFSALADELWGRK